MTFAERNELWSPARSEAAGRIEKLIDSHGLDVVRISFPDQHGLLRGKTVAAGDVLKHLRSGVSITSSLLAKDTSNKTVLPIWSAGGAFGLSALEGAGDVLMLPDPASFRILPWSPRSGWLLADLYMNDGRPVPFATRDVLASAVRRLEALGYDHIAGLEVEFHVFKAVARDIAPEDSGQPGAPPEVKLLTSGYQYLSELRYDQLEPVLEIVRRQVIELDLPVRSVECEYGPSQCEFTFDAMGAMAAADAMVLFRSAVKQICRRNGLHATFMCRPRIPNVMSSGWHLHQSLVARATGVNAFTPRDATDHLSPLGLNFLSGLITHARAAALFTTPTINGYKRFRAHSLAPDRALWGRDNRGAMLRVLSAPNDPASRIENRIGEPTANPYLYIASQIHAGIDGIERRLVPGPPADRPYDTPAPALPRSFGEAIAALREDTFYRSTMGSTFVDYILAIKEAEWARFNAEVTDWEHREYFEMF
jgi:glutamine synthetase